MLKPNGCDVWISQTSIILDDPSYGWLDAPLYVRFYDLYNCIALETFQHSFLDVQIAHSAQLTTMRLPDQQLMLKPLSKIDNPILKKRRHSK